MDQAIKARWVEALRSNEYPQTTAGFLRDNKGYCCLGVLCEIAVADGVINPPVEQDDDCYEYEGMFSVLPAEVVTWAGLEESNPWVDWPDENGDLQNIPISDPNDTGETFSDIALAIEQQL